MSNIIIITHGDLDGLTAAAILFSALKKKEDEIKINIAFAQPFNLYEELYGMKTRSLEKLFIVDIAVDEATWPRTKNSLKDLTHRAKITWIDHHRSTMRHSSELIDMDISLLLSIDRCAVSIVAEAYLHLTDNPEFFSKLVVIGEVGDKVRELDKGDPLNTYVEVLGNSLALDPADDDFKRKLVKTWAVNHTLLDDEVAKRAEEAYNRLASLLKEATKRMAYMSSRLLIIDLRDIRVHGYAGKIASYFSSKQNKITLVLFKIRENETIVTCRVPITMDIDASTILHATAAKYGGGGGGHPRAASARVPTVMLEKFLQEMIKVIDRRKNKD